MYRTYPLHKNYFAPNAGHPLRSARSAGYAVSSGSGALLKLPASDVVQNQRQTGLAGAV